MEFQKSTSLLDNTGLCWAFHLYSTEQWDSEAGLAVISIPEEMHKYPTCGRWTNPISLPLFPVLFLPLEQGAACRIPFEAGGRRDPEQAQHRAENFHIHEISAQAFPPAVSQVRTLLGVQEARQVQLKHTEMNLKNLNFRMISTQEHQQPGLFTNHFIFLNRKKESV